VQVEAIKTSVMNETPAPEEMKIQQKDMLELNGVMLETILVIVIVAILAVFYLREKKKI
jgi:uncharacterized integral membrane protein